MSDSKHFLSPRLTGKRFDDHSVPVDILQDFAALQELLIELAKNIYLEDNPKRKRVPKGFTEGVTLNLDKIEDGSAILNFFLATSLLTSPILGEDSHAYTYFEKAKNRVIAVVAAAEKGEDIRSVLPVKYLTYFNRIGRNLKDDESIYLNPSTSSNGVKLNKSTRNKIVLSVSSDSTYTDNFAITALITSINKVDKNFTLIIDGQRITAKLDHTNFKTVITTFTEFYSNTYVSIEGEGLYNRNDKLIKINSITTMDILDPLDVSLRLSELSKLKDGWYNHEGIAPKEANLIKFENLFKESFSESLPLPTIFPTLEGNIQLEWTLGTKEISLEVNLDDFNAEFMSVDVNSDDVIEEIIHLTKKTEWNKLTKYLS
ncbi:hypothetical protein OQX61_20430 [Pedobacter sp. PLR]|uniref:hypothetical protein n=1 Tax=Pedobacter sp. PLR TaxID=2994465 RepID=UPI00224755FC|nr:hypothetical protein [Pedobacter sp. PLR]MCX2453650.1 hypothetical protein [Pedobacter sp. PLR]